MPNDIKTQPGHNAKEEGKEKTTLPPLSYQTSIHSFGLSDIGGRQKNQDNFYCNDRHHFYLVADGIGGLEGGDLASLFTSVRMNELLDDIVIHDKLETARKRREQEAEMSMDEFMYKPTDIERILAHTLWFTNEELHRMAAAYVAGNLPKDKKDRRAMGTTLVAVWIIGKRLVFMNVGDSRAYTIWDDTIQRITHDHSELEDVIRKGEVSPFVAKMTVKKNTITRCLGTRPNVTADFYIHPNYPGTRILLCSDGLHGLLKPDQMLACIENKPVEAACRSLIDTAKIAGQLRIKKGAEAGKRLTYDNITAVVIDVGTYPLHQPEDEDLLAEHSIIT